MTSGSAAAAGSGAGMSIELDVLLGFVTDLQHQYDALVREGAALAETGRTLSEQAALGDFPEARLLMRRYRDACADIGEVLQEIRDATDFASRVTRWVVNAFTTADQEVADGYRSVAAASSAAQHSSTSSVTSSVTPSVTSSASPAASYSATYPPTVGYVAGQDSTWFGSV